VPGEKKMLLPLDPYVDALDIDIENIYSAAYDLGVVDGKLYMVCDSYNSITFIVNMDKLRASRLELPMKDWTWDEFKTEYAPNLTLVEDGRFTQLAMRTYINTAPIYCVYGRLGWTMVQSF
jgi:ABC-type glycerol-3-phosphate transport system substrate-binding protein